MPSSHEQREAVLLIGLEGMRYDEVASILNVPIGTVRSRLSRGRDLLRYLMGMQEKKPPSEPQRLDRENIHTVGRKKLYARAA